MQKLFHEIASISFCIFTLARNGKISLYFDTEAHLKLGSMEMQVDEI